MNKLIKILISILGGINVVFSIFTPITIALLSVRLFGFNGFWSNILIISGMLSSIFRGINIGFIK